MALICAVEWWGQNLSGGWIQEDLAAVIDAHRRACVIYVVSQRM
jgi:hypothetical protein